jgi:uncharacterized protein YdiU (UPF0061 family)
VHDGALAGATDGSLYPEIVLTCMGLSIRKYAARVSPGPMKLADNGTHAPSCGARCNRVHTMTMLSFDNRFVRELPGDPDRSNHPRKVLGACWSPVVPTPVSAPRILAYSPEMAATLDLDRDALHAPDMVDALAGNRVLDGMTTYATCYGGHQFGHWAGQLGDGRVIFLGEVVNRAGRRWEMQLKGAGRTPYSRGADGRAVLRSSVREFLCSEAMHHLGVPTTRALSLVGTGDLVERDMFYDGHPVDEPGAIVCRVAPSFIRFGHFEMPASRSDPALLKRLVDFTIARDFPELTAPEPQVYAAWYAEVCARTARLMAEWMRVGFVHGVMNTDNMSILGLTIDYGPYGWVDDFNPGWTPNTTDAEGRRYCFGRQPSIARWNVERLGTALFGLLHGDAIKAGLAAFDAQFDEAILATSIAKFGLPAMTRDDADIVNAAFALLPQTEIDMTEFFRSLAGVDVAAPDAVVLRNAFYGEGQYAGQSDSWQAWLTRYAARVRQGGEPDAKRAARMNAVNPRFVLRNYLAQQAIERAEQGDASGITELLDVLRRPYDEQPGREQYAAKRPDWARSKPGCSMLSCSS